MYSMKLLLGNWDEYFSFVISPALMAAANDANVTGISCSIMSANSLADIFGPVFLSSSALQTGKSNTTTPLGLRRVSVPKQATISFFFKSNTLTTAFGVIPKGLPLVSAPMTIPVGVTTTATVVPNVLIERNRTIT